MRSCNTNSPFDALSKWHDPHTSSNSGFGRVSTLAQFFFFVTEEIPITISRRAPDKEAWPSPYISLLFLTLALSSHQHRTLVCLFWPGILDCAHSPANPTAARQECFELLDVSNNSNCSFCNLAILWFPQSDHTVSKLSADADSLWKTDLKSSSKLSLPFA